MIKFTNVEKRYSDGNKTLRNINLQIEDGEFVFLVGHSGAGKSSILKLITREEKATRGSLLVNNKDITEIKNRVLHKYRRNLGIVFQEYRLLSEKTVFENVELALRVVGEKPKNIKSKVMKALDKVGIKDKYNKYPNELSGGECQRVGIARAIVNQPSIIVADECTGNLDMDNSISIMKLLDEVNKDGITVIMATHNLELVKEFPKRIVKIEKGQIIYDTKRDR
ncbi:MAG: cell division ATP-binding protein FtsE [Terrisporobacter sp.]|uniref:cell division ATP-binding protein FtsE n=1 Tax=Terrisporobacter sp. TaxID=1965305 RepID=UPI002FCB5D07